MNETIDDLMYESGLTAQGCWDEMDEYNRTAIMKFAELIVRECIDIASQEDFDVMMKEGYPCSQTAKKIKQRFGVEE